MPLFSLRSSEPKKIVESAKLNPEHVRWLREQIAFHDNVLPEKFLVIGAWNNRACGGLVALDKKASLVVILICNQSPLPGWIDDSTEIAWQMRHASYSELDELARGYFTSHGIADAELLELHQQRFSSDRQVRSLWFNRSQRVVLLAPEISQAAVEKISWRRFEVEIEGYVVRFIQTDAKDEFLSIEPADFMDTGKITSLVTTLINHPSSLVRRALRKTSKIKPSDKELSH